MCCFVSFRMNSSCQVALAPYAVAVQFVPGWTPADWEVPYVRTVCLVQSRGPVKRSRGSEYVFDASDVRRISV